MAREPPSLPDPAKHLCQSRDNDAAARVDRSRVYTDVAINVNGGGIRRFGLVDRLACVEHRAPVCGEFGKRVILREAWRHGSVNVVDARTGAAAD